MIEDFHKKMFFRLTQMEIFILNIIIYKTSLKLLYLLLS